MGSNNKKPMIIAATCIGLLVIAYMFNSEKEFFLDLIINGLLVGLMYALVALGFVLIYKATAVINFAQGDLVMLAGYVAAFVMVDLGVPLWLMLIIVSTAMVLFGFLQERIILRPLVETIVPATLRMASLVSIVACLPSW